MKPTKEELLRKIDALSVCDKAGIRDLVAEITGIDLTPEPTYRIGQRFDFGRGPKPKSYILANGGGDAVQAINLATGDRRGPPVRVGSKFGVTRAELISAFYTQHPETIKPI